MKKIITSTQQLSIILFIGSAFAVAISFSSCHKSSNATITSGAGDSCTFLFHFHTQIIDSTIGGNADGYDSNTTGPGITNPWYTDGLGRRIELFVPQFFVSGIQLVNANGTIYNIANAVILKGLDSEDYYMGKAPAGTYVSANFKVGLVNADSTTPPSTLFITDGIPYPLESGMWNGSDYYGMKVTGAYDTSSAGNGTNPVPFMFNMPNGITIAQTVSLPTRGTTANSYPVFVASTGSTNYVHVLCDYGILLKGIVNLKTNNSTTTDPSLADSLAGNLTNMFRYEQ
jgi:hypothetical protein